MLCPEAGHLARPSRRDRIGRADDAHPCLHRPHARAGVVNRFMREHGEAAPSAYPEVHHLTEPLRAPPASAGDAGPTAPAASRLT